MYNRLPLILILIVVLIVSFGSYIPLSVAELLYGVSITIKSFIIFLLPLIIFSLLFNAARNLAEDASKIIFLIFSCIVISNFLTTSLSYIVGKLIYNLETNMINPDQDKILVESFSLQFPSIIPNNIATFTGVILGIIFTRFNKDLANKCAVFFKKVTDRLLNIISYLIPIFVSGFVVKLQYEGVILQIIKDYTVIFAIIIFAQYGYILSLYFILNKFRIRDFISSVKNMLPATISGFTTMSSAAAMPFTIIGAEKNARNKSIIHTVIPATANVHLMGDCIAIPCFAFAILNKYHVTQPDLYTYIIFTFYFVLAKFSVAAIPGGGIIVMLPILAQYLNFNADMLSLITALYILFDSVITSANIIGNGAFAKIIDIITSTRFFKQK